MFNQEYFYISKKSLNILCWTLIFKGLIEFVYAFTIIPNYDMFYLDFNIYKYGISWLIIVISLILLSKIVSNSQNKTSTLILYLIYLVSYVPVLSFWALVDESNIFFITFNVYWYIILLLMFGYSKVKFNIPKPTFKKTFKHKTFIIIFLLFLFYGFYYSYKFAGFRLHFDLLTVYDLRGLDRSASTLEALLYHIVSVLVYPLYANYFYKKKQWSGLIITLFVQFLMFSVEGHKFYLFIIPIGLVASHFYNKHFYNLVPKLFSMAIVIGLIEQIVNGSHYINSYFVRRLLFIPALLDKYYYEFFMMNSPTYFGQDKIIARLGIESPYPIAVSRVIGEIYMDGANANTGLFGDAISNIGIYAIVLFPILFVIAMISLDFITYKIPPSYYMTVLVAIVIALLNGEMSGLIYNFIVPMVVLFPLLDIESSGQPLINNVIFSERELYL